LIDTAYSSFDSRASRTRDAHRLLCWAACLRSEPCRVTFGDGVRAQG